MALSGDKDWRKGNPNWKKGVKHSSKGRPEGGASKANSSTRRILQKLNRNPAEEMIRIADKFFEEGKYSDSLRIWENIHQETSAHPAPEDVKREEKSKKELVKALEGNDDTGTESRGHPTSVGNGKTSVQTEAGAAENLRRLESIEGNGVCDKLQPPIGEVNDNGGAGNGNSPSDPK
jgi:hypothetical protein